jgi:hypothetical protein
VETPKEFNNIWYVASRDQYAIFKTPNYLKFALFKKNQCTLLLKISITIFIVTAFKWSQLLIYVTVFVINKFTITKLKKKFEKFEKFE